METPGLVALHTIWLREHNMLAALAHATLCEHQSELAASNKPPLEVAGECTAGAAAAGHTAGYEPTDGETACDGMLDQRAFELARRLVIAELQAIVYEEFLPLLLGRWPQTSALPTYRGYNASVDPSSINEFATAAFRFGHSQAQDEVLLAAPLEAAEVGTGGAEDGAVGGQDANGAVAVKMPTAQMPTAKKMPMVMRSLPLREAFFIHADRYLSDDEHLSDDRYLSVESALLGATRQPAAPPDERMGDGLRNFLLGPGQMKRAAGQPSGFGLDLAALNIQRGRDHGLADYNTVRASLGLPAVEFADGQWNDSACAEPLRSLYGSADDVDLWIGGLCERPERPANGAARAEGTGQPGRGPPPLLGETFSAIIRAQFEAVREGDRFWYEAPQPQGLGPDLALEVRREASFGALLQRHGVRGLRAGHATDAAVAGGRESASVFLKP